MTLTDWRGARVLVTGARGFIGSHMVRRLIHAGADVIGVSRRSDVQAVPGLRWVQAELTDLATVRRLVRQSAPDLIFHFAGHVTGSQDLAHVEPTFALNLGSTVHVLTAVAEAKCGRVVLAGSMQEPNSSDSAAMPCSPYAVSKWACSAYARVFHALYGLSVVIGRPMMVYGPGQWDVSKLLPYVTTCLLTGTSPAVSSGDRELDWVFVEDVIDGFLTLSRSSAVEGRAIDFGSGTLTTVRDVVTRVAALIDCDIPIRFGARADRPFERARAANVEETRQAIGWVAATGLDEGLQRTVAWYRQEWSSSRPA